MKKERNKKMIPKSISSSFLVVFILAVVIYTSPTEQAKVTHVRTRGPGLLPEVRPTRVDINNCWASIVTNSTALGLHVVRPLLG